MSTWEVREGDCLALMAAMPEASVHAIVCDPPYDLVGNKHSRNGSMHIGDRSTPYGRSGPSKARGFMGHSWDGTGIAFDPATWQAALRVAKPGAHLLAFGGTRTFHRMAVAIEDAGWEIRDTISWLYGSGFAKSRDVSKDMDAAAGAEREAIGARVRLGDARPYPENETGDNGYGKTKIQRPDITAPATDDAKTWDGWGTALKPCWEPIIVARKPFKGTVAANVLAHGTGAINVDACRIRRGDGDRTEYGVDGDERQTTGESGIYGSYAAVTPYEPHPEGRWPPNVALDGEMAAVLDAQAGTLAPARRHLNRRGVSTGSGMGYHGSDAPAAAVSGHDDAGGPSRFMYVAKASRREREAGLEAMDAARMAQKYGSIQDARPHTREGYEYPRSERRNIHPTIKPIALMRWLVRLVTPPGGVVLDPFCGSGTTGCACVMEGFDFVGMENDREHGYVEIARRRIAHWQPRVTQLELPY